MPPPVTDTFTVSEKSFATVHIQDPSPRPTPSKDSKEGDGGILDLQDACLDEHATDLMLLDHLRPADATPQDLKSPPGVAKKALKVGPVEFAPFIDKLWPHPTAEAFLLFPEHITLYNAVKRTNLPNYLGARIQIPSQINCDAWDHALEGYDDSQVASFLRYGWLGSYTAPDIPTPSAKNHPSATAFMNDVDLFLEKEVRLGAMLGPLKAPPFREWFQTSPLMSVEKKDSDRRRVIIDLSFPEGSSVNDGVLKNHFQGSPLTYKLPTINDMASVVAALGPGAYLWKADLARAYRQLRSDPLDYPLMGVAHRGSYYADLCPSFGCRGSSAAQQRVSTAVCHLMKKKGFEVLAYIDDFCGAHSSFDEAVRAFAEFERLCQVLGLQIAPEKSAFPSTTMEWLGFQFDTTRMDITIPHDKLADIIAIAHLWSTKSRATRKELQALAGKLNHVAQCIPPARRFMSRILSLLRAAPPQGSIRVNEEVRRDVAWFVKYAQKCNGRQLITRDLPSFDIQCDACLQGGGGFFIYTLLQHRIPFISDQRPPYLPS